MQGITYLGETIAELPDNTLASNRQVLQLLHGRFGDEAGGLRKLGQTGGWDQLAVHCPRKLCGDFACDKPAGCVAKDEKCFVFTLKETWVTNRLPTVKDKLILQKLKSLQSELQKHSKRNHSETFAAEMAKTFNLAPKKYREIVVESEEDEAEQARIIRILDDFVGPTATRYDYKVFFNLIAEYLVQVYCSCNIAP